MMTTAITLTDQEETALQIIAQETGKTPDELVCEAVEQFIVQHQPTTRRMRLQLARGMWQDRTDLPSLDILRRELDRMRS